MTSSSTPAAEPAPDLWDLVPVSDRESGADTQLASIEDAIGVAETFERHSQQIDFCQIKGTS